MGFEPDVPAPTIDVNWNRGHGNSFEMLFIFKFAYLDGADYQAETALNDQIFHHTRSDLVEDRP